MLSGTELYNASICENRNERNIVAAFWPNLRFVNALHDIVFFIDTIGINRAMHP